ncbi:alpha/beta hydrolase [Sorangium sp. So ce131]|uniref:alpha/beta hydrolase n=1 Tax=Sorangium sp. So ce131 TaxID=3133282 RepID=UPI003F5FF477
MRSARGALVALPCVAALACAPFAVGCGGAGGGGGEPHASDPLPGGGEQPPPVDVPPCPEAASVEITVENTRGALAGTLEVPGGCGPFPAVVIIPGSGPNDRDGNSAAAGLGASAYRLLAEGLRDRGIASIRYDKAGVGGSVGAAPRDAREFRFEMGADDAGLWVKRLREDGRFAEIAVVGHSEGSLLGMLVAKEVEIDGYVSIAGAGRPIGEVLREQLERAIPDGELRETAYGIIEALERGQLVEEVPSALVELFHPSVQPYMISWMAYDPAVEIEWVEAPIVIVQGTTDIQVAVEDAERLAGARGDAELVLIEGMNHVLKEASLEAEEQQRAYSDPGLPVVPRVFEVIEGFLSAR